MPRSVASPAAPSSCRRGMSKGRHERWRRGGGLAGGKHAVKQQAIAGRQRPVGRQHDGESLCSRSATASFASPGSSESTKASRSSYGRPAASALAGGQPHSGHSFDGSGLGGRGARAFSAAAGAGSPGASVEHAPGGRIEADKLVRSPANCGIGIVQREHDGALRADAGACRAPGLALVRVLDGKPAITEGIDAEEAELVAVVAVGAAVGIQDRIPAGGGGFVLPQGGRGWAGGRGRGASRSPDRWRPERRRGWINAISLLLTTA